MFLSGLETSPSPFPFVLAMRFHPVVALIKHFLTRRSSFHPAQLKHNVWKPPKIVWEFVQRTNNWIVSQAKQRQPKYCFLLAGKRQMWDESLPYTGWDCSRRAWGLPLPDAFDYSRECSTLLFSEVVHFIMRTWFKALQRCRNNKLSYSTPDNNANALKSNTPTFAVMSIGTCCKLGESFMKWEAAVAWNVGWMLFVRGNTLFC